jgi:HlyD family secretion protein
VARESHAGAAARNKLRRYLPAAIPLLVVLGVLVTWFVFFKRTRSEPYTGPVWEVKKDRLQLTIVERGSLESAENGDINCRVKARAQGSTVASTIKWVIDNGMEVTRGQKIIELDDSGLQEQLKTQNITLNSARSNWIQADKNCAIQESQNFSDIETAKVNLILAELDLRKYAGDRAGIKLLSVPTRLELQNYLSGAFLQELRADGEKGDDKLNSEVVQTLNDIEGRIEMSRSDREQALDRASWSKRMVNRQLLSRSQADADKAKFESMEFNLKKVQGELDIFKKYTLERTVTDLWSKVKEAERALDRVKTQAAAKQVSANADRDGKRAIFGQEESRRHELEEEINKCLILAPQDGMVVYYVPENTRFGSGSNQSIVAQGEPVREGQKMMRIPDLTKMQVNVRVHEAMVSKVKGEVRRPTGYGARLRAAFSFGLVNPLAVAGYNYGYFGVHDRDESFRDKEEDVIYEGQEARMQVDAYPGKIYKGHVKTIDTVASQADFLSSDVKLYQTIVSLDGTVHDLRPGMSSEVTILASEASGPALVVPIQSVVGKVSMGNKRKCFVLDERNVPHERDIEVGMSNDKLVEVNDGLQEGDKIVLSPRTLLNEKSDLRAGTPATRRGTEFEEGAGAGKKKGKGGMKGGPRPGGVPPEGGAPGGPPPGAGGAPPRGFNQQ